MDEAVNRRRFNYGISLAYGPNSVDSIINTFHSTLFTAAQVTESVASENEFDELTSVDICNLFPLSLTRSISLQSKRIVDGFVSQFSSFISKRDTCSFDSLTLDFELSEARIDELRLKNSIALLKRMSVQMNNKGITLCLPVRIPDVSDCDPQFYLSFLEQLMCYDIQFCLDIHPHELTKGYSVEDLLKWYQFDIKSVRFIYEPEAGNNLVEPLLKPWIEFLKKRCFTGNVFFAPVISSESYYCDEMLSVQSLISKL